MNDAGRNELLQSIVTNACDEIGAGLSRLKGKRASPEQLVALVDLYAAQLGNISDAAEMALSIGIHEIASQLLLDVQALSSDDAKGTRKFGNDLIKWGQHVSTYIENPSTEGIRRKLIAPLNDEMKDSIAEMLDTSIECTLPAVMEDYASVDSIFEDSVIADELVIEEAYEPVTENIEEGVDEISQETGQSNEAAERTQCCELFDVLSEELTAICPQLESILNSLLDAEDASADALRYTETVSRIGSVCGDIGAPGLKEVCEFVLKNTHSLSVCDKTERIAAGDVFKQWPICVLDYLRNPDDVQVCLDLLMHLQSESWPNPYSEDEVHSLLEALAVLPTDDDQASSVERRQVKATVEDVALEFEPDVNPVLIDAFFKEAPTVASEFSTCMSHLGDPGENVSISKSAQRLTHTLKGSANLVGARGIANMSHHLEDILEYLAKSGANPPKDLIYDLQESSDCIETMIEALYGSSDAPMDAQRILQNVLDWANRIDQGQFEDFVAPESRTEEITVSGDRHSESDENFRIHAVEKPAERRTDTRRESSNEILHVPTAAVDKMFRLAGEMSIAIGQVQEHLNRLVQQGRGVREQDNIVQKRRFELENLVGIRSFAGMQRTLQRVSGHDEIFDSLELDQYDEFYSSAHSFIESVNDSRELSMSFQGEISNLDALFTQHKILNDELQQMIMATRMVPVSTVASRLQRSVRQACRATGKHAKLNIDGEELMMDSEVLRRLVDPLTHILRNSIDHGIESENERLATKKPSEGLLSIRFAQDGNDMVIVCSDDGRGLNFDEIRDVAVRKRFINKNQKLADEDLVSLLLQSGFSTRDNVTQVSGRGVGLDVVHTTVRSLKGMMSVNTGENGGCVVTLRLPITLISTHALLTEVGGSHYAIPTNDLEQILAPGSGKLDRLGNKVTFRHENTVYPTRLLSELLSIDDEFESSFDASRPVLIVRGDNELVAIVISRVVNSYDIVIKGLGAFVREIDGVGGISILGDGSVVPVLDLPRLINTFEQVAAQIPYSPQGRTTRRTAAAGLPSILIVDDSLSVRTSLGELASDMGFEPRLARDGLEAIDLLRKYPPVAVLVDLEMPNMNGLELTSHIRADERFRNLPIVMITSRTQKKHRDQAAAAGVSNYVTKPYSEDDLAELIQSFAMQETGT